MDNYDHNLNSHRNTTNHYQKLAGSSNVFLLNFAVDIAFRNIFKVANSQFPVTIKFTCTGTVIDIVGNRTD